MKDYSVINQRNLARHFLYHIRSVPVDPNDPMKAVVEMQRLAGPAFVAASKAQLKIDDEIRENIMVVEK